MACLPFVWIPPFVYWWVCLKVGDPPNRLWLPFEPTPKREPLRKHHPLAPCPVLVPFYFRGGGRKSRLSSKVGHALEITQVHGLDLFPRNQFGLVWPIHVSIQPEPAGRTILFTQIPALFSIMPAPLYIACHARKCGRLLGWYY